MTVFCVSFAVGGSQVVVRYITEDLIHKITKEENLDMVTSLNLTLSKEVGKKIKVSSQIRSVCVCPCMCVCAHLHAHMCVCVCDTV